MKKVLVPIDSSDRSIKSIEKVRSEFDPSQVQITLLTALETPIHYKYEQEYQHALHRQQENLENYKKMLPEYEVAASVVSGKPGPAIVRFAEQNEINCIVMTRSPGGSAEMHGSVSAYVAKKAPFLELIILQEKD